MVLLLDVLDGIVILLSKGLVLVALNTHGRWLDVAVMRTLHFVSIVMGNLLLSFRVPANQHTFIHGLVEFIDLLSVAESRVHFLLDDLAHAIRKLVVQWIQKGSLVFDLLRGISSHGNVFLEIPLVHLAQLSQFHIHVSLVDNVNEELSQTLVETLTVFLRKARFFDDLDLPLIRPLVHSDLLTIELEGRKFKHEFFIHLVSLKAAIF